MTDTSLPEIQWYDVKDGVDMFDVLCDFCDAQDCTDYDYMVVYSADRKQYRFQAVTTEEHIKTKLLEQRGFITRNATLGAMLVLLCGEPDPPFVRSPHNTISDRTGTEVDAWLNGCVFYFTADKRAEETIWDLRLGNAGEHYRSYWRKTTGHRPVRQEKEVNG